MFWARHNERWTATMGQQQVYGGPCGYHEIAIESLSSKHNAPFLHGGLTPAAPFLFLGHGYKTRVLG